MHSTNPADQLRRSVRDPEAFGSFYDAYFEDLLRYLTRCTCDAEAGLDLTAESFAQAYLSRHRFRGTTGGEAAAWLYRIAKRQLARYFKRGRAELRALERLGLERPELDPGRARDRAARRAGRAAGRAAWRAGRASARTARRCGCVSSRSCRTARSRAGSRSRSRRPDACLASLEGAHERPGIEPPSQETYT